MDYLTFTRLGQKHKLSHPGLKGELKWLAVEEDAAIVSLSTSAGINCVLHVSPELRGSLFDFHYKDYRFILIADYVLTRDAKIYKMNFLVEYVV